MLFASSIAARQLLNLSRPSCMHCFSHVLHLSIILSSIAPCNVHAFIWISLYPLIILDHLYVSRVKLSSFFYLLSIMIKRGRNCDVVSFFKILHVRGRNTFLCKGELCFILLRGVLASPCCFRSFFWLLVHWSYDHFYIHCYYL